MKDDPDKRTGWTRRATCAAVAALVGAGCLGQPRSEAGSDDGTTDSSTVSTDTPTATPLSTPTPPVDSPKVADVLVGLVRAEDRAAYAAANDLDYRDGRVLVVVELVPDGELPTDVPLDIVARGATSVEAYVDPADVPRLATDEDVRVVRPPRSTAPQSTTD
ncbi:hypothetical protein [Salinigranum marinum]|uniref:hypothetical protein n=1 Tax=Salinigranum marinum TaxID=1515595 RepID=UPI002989F08D|nr:hypothetical protein [Salinigranum marinum]